MGFDSSLRGGSFLGKKNSSRPRKSDFHSGSKVSGASSRCSSGSLPEAGVRFGFTSADAIVLGSVLPRGVAISWRCPSYTDEQPFQQVAFLSPFFSTLKPGLHCP